MSSERSIYHLGFDYRFDALSVDEEPNELNKAFGTLFHADNNFSFFQIMQAFIPAMRIFVREAFCLYALIVTDTLIRVANKAGQ